MPSQVSPSWEQMLWRIIRFLLRHKTWALRVWKSCISLAKSDQEICSRTVTKGLVDILMCNSLYPSPLEALCVSCLIIFGSGCFIIFLSNVCLGIYHYPIGSLSFATYWNHTLILKTVHYLERPPTVERNNGCCHGRIYQDFLFICPGNEEKIFFKKPIWLGN